MGVVLRTGYTSFRGRILREMLFPKQSEFMFFRKGIYFLLILMCIGIVVYLIELKWVIAIGLPTTLIVTRFFDTALWMIPPALPIFFSIC
jgi:cation-transporting P-type ATPase 13A2